MASTGAERLFALGRAHDVRAGASRYGTHTWASSSATPKALRPNECRCAQTARRSGNCCARGRGRASR
eukprot:2803926-Pleurochrysis_carterae.AAC.1